MHEEGVISAAVVALAGRRVDAEGTDPPRFPLVNVPLVRERLAQLLVAEHTIAVVCSAACGADLIALEEAEQLGLRRRIVLPFSPERFRDTSVIDRPGDWRPVFDRLIVAARDARDLVVLDASAHDGDAAYAAANEAIIQEARALAYAGEARRLVAVVVSEGATRSGRDATEGFRKLAAKAGIEQRTVLTL